MSMDDLSETDMRGLDPLRPIYICGATASGKSGLALELARALDGEVVNVDPYQAYAGLPILTAAPRLEEMGEVPHHLYQCIPLEESLDAASYQARVLPVVAEVQGRGKVPILVGGSGMYLKFLTHGSAEVPSGDAELRQKMEGMTLQEIRHELNRLDPEESARLELDNRRHLSRALEICWLTGERASGFRKEWAERAEVIEAGLRGVVLMWPREILVERITQRARMMFAEGVVEEVRAQKDLRSDCTAAQAIGFSDVCSFIEGKISEAECVERLLIATRQYAKRQRNWFRREGWLQAVEMGEEKRVSVEELVLMLGK